MTDSIAGIILAGGRSRRMGEDKSLMRLAGSPLVARVTARLTPQSGRLALNANGDPQRYEFLGLPIVADTVGDFAGPLAGILAGLRWAGGAGFRQAATVATDTPFFPVDLVEQLERATQDEDMIAVARCGGRAHPVFALWPTDCAPAVDAFLQSGQKASVLGFIERQRHVFVDFEPIITSRGPLDPFFNINTPAELAEAEQIAAELDQ